VACSTGDCGLDDALLTDCEAFHIRSKLCDDAAELVAERDGDGVVSARVRFYGCEGRAAKILVQISAADAYVRGRDLFDASVAHPSEIW